MGTRADFYMGRGKDAKWLGSIAWDGYPEGIDKPVLKATTEKQYLNRLTKFFASREDVTVPEQGWPWPWDNSQTTDYAYAFDGNKVWASCFGNGWFDAAGKEPDYEGQDNAKVEFPDMSAIKRVNFGKRSGLIVIRAGGIVNDP